MRTACPRRIVGLITTTVLVVAWGCGEGAAPADSSSTEATVTGTVTIKGKRATGGEISFDPSNVNRKMEPPRRTEITKEGTYTVKTLVGDNVVRLSTPEVNKDRQLGGQDYTVNVKPGENTYDLTITAPAPAPASDSPSPGGRPSGTGR